MLPWSSRKPPGPQSPRVRRPAWLQTSGPRPASAPRRTSRPDAGQRWEEEAAQWLQGRGLCLIATRVRCRRGEIDLIMATGTTAIIVEVRQRSQSSHGQASESIDWHKRKRIVHAALVWWHTTGQHRFSNLRFDTVTFTGNQPPLWTVHAFDTEGSI